MDEALLRQQVSNAARQLWMKGLLVADGGLLSAEVHRRRYLITPPGKRRSDLLESDLRLCDIGGLELGGGQGLDEVSWRVHRVAYQVGLERQVGEPRPDATFRDGAAPPIHATVHTTPPMLMALLRLRPTEMELRLPGLAPVLVVDPADEAAVRRALDQTCVLALGRGGGLFCATAEVWEAVNLLERLELAAAIEIACRPNP